MLQEAENDFIKARNKALFNEIQHFLNPEEASMISLKAVKNLIKTENETYIGMQVVPIDKIFVSQDMFINRVILTCCREIQTPVFCNVSKACFHVKIAFFIINNLL